MDLDCTMSNGETKTRASRFPVTIVIDSIERFEDSGERFLRNARTEVSHADNAQFFGLLDCHQHICVFGCIPHGISNGVLDCAANELFISLNHNRSGRGEEKTAFSL